MHPDLVPPGLADSSRKTRTGSGRRITETGSGRHQRPRWDTTTVLGKGNRSGIPEKPGTVPGPKSVEGSGTFRSLPRHNRFLVMTPGRGDRVFRWVGRKRGQGGRRKEKKSGKDGGVKPTQVPRMSKRVSTSSTAVSVRPGGSYTRDPPSERYCRSHIRTRTRVNTHEL